MGNDTDKLCKGFGAKVRTMEQKSRRKGEVRRVEHSLVATPEQRRRAIERSVPSSSSDAEKE